MPFTAIPSRSQIFRATEERERSGSPKSTFGLPLTAAKAETPVHSGILPLPRQKRDDMLILSPYHFPEKIRTGRDAHPVGITAVPAHANQWLVYTGGDRPNRTFTVIDEDYISPEFNSDTSFKVEAATIYEAPSQPDWSTANYHVDCIKKTLRIDLVQISPRDGALRRRPDVADHAPANVTEHQILTFACDKGRKSAQRASEREANNDPRNFIYLGPISLPKVVDVAWEKLWTDGKRPGYSSNVSIADQNAQVEKIMKEKQALVAQAGAIAEQSQRDADAIAASQKSRKDRMKREKAVAPALEEWIGKSVAEVTAAFGPRQAAATAARCARWSIAGPTAKPMMRRSDRSDKTGLF